MNAVRRMIQKRLPDSSNALINQPALTAGAHLDEDALSAFTEGRLTHAESAPVIKHLVTCAFCRHITAQLVRLESEIEVVHKLASSEAADQPSRIRSLLEELSARVMPSSEDDAVFAYHAPAEDFERKSELTGENENTNEERDPEK